ncbi:hypothetical protein E2C01_099104 [Portunus trituberculatus]|uniref:Uncharacterized protein n=1 Tax=Portunus trituberculatus TaxID=210409 RepID=A0A5B7K4K2_PORTR|nr:hypothetical protein [Portunus trituberculatus]
MRQCVKDIGKHSFPHRTVENGMHWIIKLLQHIMCITLGKNLINGDMETRHYEPCSNPVQYN